MESKTCVIGIKQGITHGYTYGWVFEELTPCCQTFSIWFQDTGNLKLRTFNHPGSEEKSGLSLVTRGSEPALVLKAQREDAIKYCPFCAAKIEIKVVKVIELRNKFRQERDGFEEIVLHPKSEPKTEERMYEGDLR